LIHNFQLTALELKEKYYDAMSLNYIMKDEVFNHISYKTNCCTY